MNAKLNQIDTVEIVTLQDNYIDLVAKDNNEIVQRAMPLKERCRMRFVKYGRHKNDILLGAISHKL